MVKRKRKASVIVTGEARTRQQALNQLATFGTVDESTLTFVDLPGIYVEGKFVAVAATKYTAEVTPK